MKSLQFIRINSNFEPHIVVTKLREVSTQTIQITADYTIVDERVVEDVVYADVHLKTYYDENEKTYYSYGLLTRGTKDKPGHKGYWSSNTETINRLFGTSIVHCAVKEEQGEYPRSFFAMAVPMDEIPVPDCLKWGDGCTFIQLVPKEGVTFPRRKDYFTSTVLDAEGKLILPLIKV